MKIVAQKREVAGKKVKTLRSQEIVPASVYGPKKPSTNIQLDKKPFLKLFKTVGFNKFFDLQIEDGKPAKVLVKEIQKHPVTDKLISVSLYQVDEDRKITVEVPVHFLGEAPAVKQNLGFLIHQMDTIAVHCYPKDLPNDIELDISGLENPGDAITVGDVSSKFAEGVELASDMDVTSSIVMIAAPQKEEEVVAPVAEGVEGAEGTAPAEVEAASEEKAE